MKKNKSKLKSDLKKNDQALSFFKNINHFINLKHSKKNLYLILS